MRWLLTYADLITLLLVFFIVLYSISQVDQQKYIALANALRQALLAQYSGNAVIPTAVHPVDVPQNMPEEAAAAQLAARLREALAKSGSGVEAQVEVSPAGVVVHFTADSVFFEKASAELRPAFRKALLSIAPVLAGIPNPVRVEGYTDNEPLHSPLYPTAWELSAARATNVVRFLTEEGHLDPHRFAAVAYGEWHPKFSNDTPEGQAKNRRVDILVLNASPASRTP